MSTTTNVEILSDEDFKKIMPFMSTFFKTGSMVFFGKGKDVDYVIPVSTWNEITGNDILLLGEEMVCFKRSNAGGCSYDFIVVRDKNFSSWELATITAKNLCEQNVIFKEWFEEKINRQQYFSAFIYK